MPKAPSLLRLDPSRTLTLRKAFMRAIGVRLSKLKGSITSLMVREDIFGLLPSNKIENTRWRFRTSDDQVKLFELWLKTQIDAGVLPANTEEAYWNEYIRQGYLRGQARAFDDARIKDENLDFYNGKKSEFLESAFRQPVAVEKVKLLASRVYTDLKGVTDAMSADISRLLVDGLIRGDNPRDIARAMNLTVDKIGRNRANTIARTEIIRAHAEGQIDAFERLGVKDLGVMTEWSTAGDDRVCPLCAPLNGIIITLKEARGMLPRHPNCRCVWIPANVGETPTGQKRGQRKITKAIDKSIRAEIPKSIKRELAAQKSISPWVGAGKTIDKKRPVPIVSERKLNKAIRVGKKAAELGNIGPTIAAEVVKETGADPKTVKIALAIATIGDFSVPGIPVGSAIVSLIAGAKDPKALIRAVKAVVKRMKGGS